jgi:hypothetical protein
MPWLSNRCQSLEGEASLPSIRQWRTSQISYFLVSYKKAAKLAAVSEHL